MLLENMFMALHAIKANKMRSFLTMLGIIIGIGSVIAIVSIGDTMRSMVADLYANVGMTRAIIYIWPSDGGDMRDSDYFNLEQMERIKEVFHDDIEYMDTNAYYSSEALFGRKKVKFQFQGIDYNYPDVQKINILYGRNLNEADIKGRKKNVVLEAQGALELFGTENAVGKTLRTTVYGETDDYNVVGVYKKEMTPFEAMMMSMMPGQTKEGFIPYTILSWPNDYLFQLNFYAKEGTDMNELSGRMVPYLARLKDRQPADVTFYSALDEMKGNDSMMSSLSAAVGGIAAISLL
ncbi:ABC transporter permease, partial [Hungatella sp.]